MNKLGGFTTFFIFLKKVLTGCAIGAVYRYEIYQDRIIFERYKKSADS